MELLQQSPVLINQVYDRLCDAIGNCEFAPGQRIRQADLANNLGVSRQPVSHALQLLKRDGLVVDFGRKGLMVATLDAEQLLQTYQVRAALDSLSAQLAAERVAAGLVSKQEIAALNLILSDAERFDDSTIRRDRVNADLAFHQQVTSMSGNARIAETLAPLFTHISRTMHLVLNQARFRHAAWEEHRTIAKLICAGDPAAAEMALEHASRAGRETYQDLRTAEQKQMSA